MNAAPKLHATIWRLVPLPSVIKLPLLAVSNINFKDWMKTTILSNILLIPFAMTVEWVSIKNSDRMTYEAVQLEPHPLNKMISYAAGGVFVFFYIGAFIVARMGPTKSPLAPPEKTDSKKRD